MNNVPKKSVLLGKLALETAMGNFLGDTRIKLLEAIDRHGSISQAAKAVPLSYKAAWDAVDSMNNLAPEPLVVRTTGGKHGGGTELTSYARRLIGFYRALELEYQASIDRLAGRLDDDAQEHGPDIDGFRKLLRRMSMQSSARNQFAGPIEEIRQGAVDCEIRIRLDGQHDLTAFITRESAENLKLAVGKEVQAFVKSSSILLVMGEAAGISARNRFYGEVVRITEGSVNAEVTLTLPGGHHVITAVITRESLKNLHIAVGCQATAVFKASSVFVAVNT